MSRSSSYSQSRDCCVRVFIVMLATVFAVALALPVSLQPQQALAKTALQAGSIDESQDAGDELKVQDGSVSADLTVRATISDPSLTPDGGQVEFIFNLESSPDDWNSNIGNIYISSNTPRFIIPKEINDDIQSALNLAANKRISELTGQELDTSLMRPIPNMWQLHSAVDTSAWNSTYAGHLSVEFEEGFVHEFSPFPLYEAFYFGEALGSIDFSNYSCSYYTYLPNLVQCTHLTQVTLPTSGEWRLSDTFMRSGIESIYIPNSIVQIDSNAFGDCKNLRTVTFQEGSTLERIDGFNGCTNLNASAVLANMPSTVTAIGSENLSDYSRHYGAFDGCSFPQGIVIPEGITYIGADAFRGATGLDGSTVVVPASVTTVRDSAFAFGTDQETSPSATIVFENPDLEFVELPSNSYYKTRGRACIDGVEYENPFGDTVVNIIASAYTTSGEASALKRFYTDGEVLHGTGDDAEWVPTSEAQLSEGVVEYQFSSPISAQASFKATGNALSISSSRITVGEPFTVKAYYQLEEGATSGTVGFTVPNNVQVLSISDASQKLSVNSNSASVNANAGVLYVRMQASAPGVHMIDMRLNGGSAVASTFANAAGVYIEGSSQDSSITRGMALSVRTAPLTQVSVVVTGGDTVTATTNKRGLATLKFSVPEDAATAGSVHVAVKAGEGLSADTVEDDLSYTAPSADIRLKDFMFVHGAERVVFIENGIRQGASYYRSYSNIPTVDQADWTLYVTVSSSDDLLNSMSIKLNTDAMGVTEPDCAFDLTLDSKEQVNGRYVYHFIGKYQDMAYLHDALAYKETGKVAMGLYFAIKTIQLSGKTAATEGTESIELGPWWFAISAIMDPSGTVYEAVPSNYLSGVTAEVFYSATNPGAGDVASGTSWDAQNYDQVNPQITGADGSYAWDVPDGFYQVRFTKTGYVPAATDWMEVQPPRFGLSTPLVYKGAAAVQEVVVNEETGAFEIVFDRHVDTSTASVLIDGVAVNSSRLTWEDVTQAPVYTLSDNVATQMGTASLSRSLRVTAPEGGWSASSAALRVSGVVGYNGVAVPEYTATLALPFDAPEPTMYAVTFDAGNGSALDSTEIEEGSTITEPNPAPVREGYRFDYWYAGDTDTGAYNFTTQVTGPVNLHAKWVKQWTIAASSPDSMQGTVKIGSRIAAVSDSVTVDEASSVSITAIPAEGYHFLVWTEDDMPLLGSSATYTDANVAADHTLVAVFERDFVPVVAITGVPTAGVVGTDLALYGNVSPDDATNSTIQWSLVNGGGTGVALTTTGVLTGAIAAGTVTVCATVVDGLEEGDFTQNFTITLAAPSNPDNPPATTATITVVGADGGSLVGGKVIGAGSYAVGALVTLTAIPDTGYDFAGWKASDNIQVLSALDIASIIDAIQLKIMALDGEYISTEDTISFYAKDNVTIQAVFEEQQTNPNPGGDEPGGADDPNSGGDNPGGSDNPTDKPSEGDNATDDPNKASGKESNSDTTEKTTESGGSSDTKAVSSTSTKASATSGSSTVKTGDTTLPIAETILLGIAILSSATIVFLLRRRQS